jgi:photosynthetic reaction center cytochrome c subunit
MRIMLSSLAVVTALLLTIAMMLGWERPPMDVAQLGYRGTGMEQVTNPRLIEDAPAIPAALYPPEPTDGPRASEIYENVQVLGDLSDAQFNRLMAHVTEWVAPEQGCGYCHNLENLADDSVYTKIVARRMFQMTWDINENWDSHVGDTGVTCYTCHLGQPVPANIWFENTELPSARGMLGDRNGQNVASEVTAYSSLPYDALTDYLSDRDIIRVNATTALPTDYEMPIQSAEATYGLMMHMSDSLGVNCVYCHNTRSFSSWDTSPPARTTAWHGINLVRALNEDYLLPLEPAYPPNRLGPIGDAPKAVCSTCHNGINKPLGGVSMLEDHPELAGRPEVAQAPASDGGEAPPQDAPDNETTPTTDSETPVMPPVDEEGNETVPEPQAEPADDAAPATDDAAPGTDAAPETDAAPAGGTAPRAGQRPRLEATRHRPTELRRLRNERGLRTGAVRSSRLPPLRP